jgi:hypothetical protein
LAASYDLRLDGKLAATPYAERNTLLEGQMRLSFVSGAAAAAGVRDCTLILVDCDDATRTRRLIVDRDSSDLATTTMMLCVEQVWMHFGQ